MHNIKQVIVVRKDLNMRKGKLAAQVAHASMGVLLNNGRAVCEFIEDPYNFNNSKKFKTKEYTFNAYIYKEMYEWLESSFTKIVVGCSSLEELLKLENKAKEKNIPHCLIEDNGITEFKGVKTKTALAIGPYISEVLDKITGHLKLL